MSLKRTLTLPLLTFYGLGSIIGAGIYALIGSVIKEANIFTTVSFLIAAIIALFTAATYAELSARFPESAGSALYIKKAFNRSYLSGLIGWFVVLTGMISCSALVHGLINYLHLYVTISTFILIPIIVIILGGITIWGITESAITIFIMTALEIIGLLIIIWYGKNNLINGFKNIQQYIPPIDIKTWGSILNGAFIAFYAFIGFEDMVNVAEETINPEKMMPKAIFLAATFACLLYITISFVTITSFNADNLQHLTSPLTLIISNQGHSPLLFSIIAMISITNGILVNMIMASRLIFGMTKLKTSPSFFSYIYEKTQVPLFATFFVMTMIIILAYWFPIQTLAKITSGIMLIIFCMMHFSLMVIKIKYPSAPNHINLPFVIPFIGFILSFIFLLAANYYILK